MLPNVLSRISWRPAGLYCGLLLEGEGSQGEGLRWGTQRYPRRERSKDWWCKPLPTPRLRKRTTQAPVSILGHSLIHLSRHPSIALSIPSSLTPSLPPSIHLSIHPPSIHPSIHLPTHPPIHPSLPPSLHPSICPSTHPHSSTHPADTD